MSDTQWHLDKRLPVGIILGLLLQGAGVVWWVRGTANELQDARRRIDQIDAQRISERLTALESQMTDSRSSLNRIEGKLDRLIEARR